MEQFTLYRHQCWLSWVRCQRTERSYCVTVRVSRTIKCLQVYSVCLCRIMDINTKDTQIQVDFWQGCLIIFRLEVVQNLTMISYAWFICCDGRACGRNVITVMYCNQMASFKNAKQIHGVDTSSPGFISTTKKKSTQRIQNR